MLYQIAETCASVEAVCSCSHLPFCVFFTIITPSFFFFSFLFSFSKSLFPSLLYSLFSFFLHSFNSSHHLALQYFICFFFSSLFSYLFLPFLNSLSWFYLLFFHPSSYFTLRQPDHKIWEHTNNFIINSPAIFLSGYETLLNLTLDGNFKLEHRETGIKSKKNDSFYWSFL